MNALMEISAGTGVDFWADHRRCFTIVQLQNRVTQVNEFVEYCRSALAMVYNTKFPRNPAPQDFAELMGKFRRATDIRHFVKIQLVAGAKLALAWVRVHKSTLDIDAISRGFPARRSNKRVRMTRHYDAAHEPVIRMIQRLLDADSAFFTEFHYANPV